MSEFSCLHGNRTDTKLVRIRGGEILRKLKKYTPTKFKAEDSIYDKDAADFAVMFIESLCHTKGTWAGKKFELIDWQEPDYS